MIGLELGLTKPRSAPYFWAAELSTGALPSGLAMDAAPRFSGGGLEVYSGDRLYHPNVSALVDGGRLGLEFNLLPRITAAAHASPLPVWTIDGSNYASVHHSTRVLTVAVGGVSYAFGTAVPAWSAGAPVDLWIEAGGGSLVSRAKARVGGTVTDLGSSVSALGAVSGGVTVDLVTVFDSIVVGVRAYRVGKRPAWTTG